ncbi:MAG: phosphatase domain-containing protein [Gammaproteobacteria bacterium]
MSEFSTVRGAFQGITAAMRKRLGALFLLLGAVAWARADVPKADEQVILFPALAWHTEDGWAVDIHGWIFEPNLFGEISGLFRKAIGLPAASLNADEESILAQRAHWFTVDNEGGKRLAVTLNGRAYELAESKPNGHFRSQLSVSAAEAEQLRARAAALGARPSASIVTTFSDDRRFKGDLLFLEKQGVSVISDIDDTIKISVVTDKRELLKNTFLRPFQPVPGMAELYQRWAREAHAEFHYLSASPWQLYVPLDDFLRRHGFPQGSFHLKLFRWKDSSFFNLFEDPIQYKEDAIADLLGRYPDRRFLLIGDSGEKDPETYGAIARRYSRQVAAIVIRAVAAADNNPARFQTAFTGLSPALWQVFSNPDQIRPIAFPPAQ